MIHNIVSAMQSISCLKTYNGDTSEVLIYDMTNKRRMGQPTAESRAEESCQSQHEILTLCLLSQVRPVFLFVNAEESGSSSLESQST